MQTALRPWITSGIALVGASVIVIAPVAPPPPVEVAVAHVPSVHLPAVQLSASILEIFTFPAFRQYFLNYAVDLVTLGVGVAQASANLGQAIGLLPETLRLLTQQLLTLDLQGALTTIETALIGTVVAVGAPLLDALITVRERSAAVQLAMVSAVPRAILGAGAAVLDAIDGVLRASIAGGQEIVDAVLTLNLGNILDALVNATGNFLGSFVDGGQIIVDGIVFAQQTIATALATPAPPAAAAEVSRVPNLEDRGATTMVLSTDSAVIEQDSTEQDFAADATGTGSPGADETVIATDEEAAEDESTAGEDEETPDEADETDEDSTPVGDPETDISDPTETTADTTADAPSDTDDRDSAASDGGDTESADTA
jgi:hypothetical protein